MIDHESGAEWWDLCQNLVGKALTPVEDYATAVSPGVAGRLCIFDIPDDSRLATWIAIKHPRWIEPKWLGEKKYQQVILDNPDYPFMEMIEDEE